MNHHLLTRAEALEARARRVEAHAVYADGQAYCNDMRLSADLHREAAGLREAALTPEERQRRDQWLEAMASARERVMAIEQATRRVRHAEQVAWRNFLVAALYGESRSALRALFPNHFDSFWPRWCGAEGTAARESWLARHSGALSAYNRPMWRQNEIDQHNNHDGGSHGHQVVRIA